MCLCSRHLPGVLSVMFPDYSESVVIVHYRRTRSTWIGPVPTTLPHLALHIQYIYSNTLQNNQFNNTTFPHTYCSNIILLSAYDSVT